MRSYSILAAAALAFAQSPDAITRQLGGMRGVVIGPVTPEAARNGEGSTIRLKDGTLLHAFSRHMRPADLKKYPNADLWPSVVARTESHDGGRTWSEPAVMFRSTTGENAMQPSFARLANGEIGVAYSRIDSLSAATKVFRYSADEGRTWSGEILVSPTGQYWTSAHDRLLVLSTGRILLTLHHKIVVTPEHIITQVALSDDHGRTWRRSPQQIDVGDVIPEFRARQKARFAQGYWEASIAERADGSLFMIGRTYGGWLYGCESRDGGETWSKPSPTTLVSGAAPGRMIRVPGSNDLLVIWNSCCLNPAEGLVGQRLTLSSAISRDGGKTWAGLREIESVVPGGRVDYPAISIYDGRAYVTYRAQARGTGQQEYLSIIPMDWFYAVIRHHRPETAITKKED